MKMKTENQAKQNTDKSHQVVETLADLPVSDEEARHAKGGSDDMPVEEITFIHGEIKVLSKR